MTYIERVTAIVCPNCGSTRWKKHGTISCSIVPFEAECSLCKFTPSAVINRRLCPRKEFVFHDSNWNVVRHLVCFFCGKEEKEFDMEAGEGITAKTVEFGYWPNESTWILPGQWTMMNYHITDFDGNPIVEPILFCSTDCRIKHRMLHND